MFAGHYPQEGAEYPKKTTKTEGYATIKRDKRKTPPEGGVGFPFSGRIVISQEDGDLELPILALTDHLAPVFLGDALDAVKAEAMERLIALGGSQIVHVNVESGGVFHRNDHGTVYCLDR